MKGDSKLKILNRYTGEIIFELYVSQYETMKELVELAVKNNINLRNANLQGADLQGVDLRWADLRNANLQGADLRWANLQGADLQGADLQGADLRNANLDFSSGMPFHCGVTQIKIDDRIASQLIYHLTRQNIDHCSGGVKESIEQIKRMAISDLFCEYRDDVKKLEE